VGGDDGFSDGRQSPVYTRLNQLLAEHHFDDFVEGQCQPFYAEIMGPSRRSHRVL
jgi:hypothetical protein